MEETAEKSIADRSPTRSRRLPTWNSAPITEALEAWSRGAEGAEQQLFALSYERLHRLARGLLSVERRRLSLGPTVLLHEAYLRLAGSGGRRWSDRQHFLATLARVMRHSLVDHARRRRRQKRNWGRDPLPLEAASAAATGDDQLLLALDDALAALTRIDPFKVKVVELRFFAGYSIAETAMILGCGHSKIERHWRLAQGWLHRHLQREVGA